MDLILFEMTSCNCREDEGRDLARKRGTEFKLPYALADSDLAGNFVTSSLDDDVTKVRSPKSSKRSKTQLRDYLQVKRKVWNESLHSVAARLAQTGKMFYCSDAEILFSYLDP